MSVACLNQRLIQPASIGNLVVPNGMNAELIGPVVTVTGTVTVQGTSILTVTGGGVQGLGSATPNMDGTASTGTSPLVAHQDHTHPSDTSRAPLTGGGTSGTWPISITGAAATVVTNANLTGVVTSIGNVTSIGAGAITDAMLANSAVANLSGTNSGDVTVGTANGLSLSGQSLSLQIATNSVPGALSAADHTLLLAALQPGGALGTPASGNLANCTFPTLNQNTTGTAANLTAGVALPVATTLTVKDTTSASPDYALGIGETATVTFSAAMTVNLNIATVPGLYELSIQCDSTTTVGSNKTITLFPNNASTGGACNNVLFAYRDDSSSGTTVSNSINCFLLGWCVLWQGSFHVSTKTTSKNVIGEALYKDSSEGTPSPTVATVGAYWTDTTTAWTSLGYLLFGQSQTGTVTIRRIS